MSKTLYIFNYEKLSNFKSEFKDYKFISIASIFNIAENLNDLEYLDEEIEYENYVIDISLLVDDNYHHKMFIAQYLDKLVSNNKVEFFSIEQSYQESFLKKFPYVFEEINEDYSAENIISKQIENHEQKVLDKLSLFFYKSSELIHLKQDKNIISIGSILENGTFLNYELTTDMLKSSNIDYVDITPISSYVVVRKDLIFSFEIILRKICSEVFDIKFIIDVKSLNDLEKFYPYLFNVSQINIHNIENDENLENDAEFNFQNIELVINKLNQNLIGHTIFKEDIAYNLKKFYFLNNLNKRRILSVFLSGESGVGKTEFAKILSNAMYTDNDLIKINFGNYSEKHILSSLIGSPPGYIGSDEGGELINKLKSSNSKVILIDEFEKADSSIFNFFYELLEDGKFTDRHGVEHDLNKYIIVFTSNFTEEGYKNRVPDSLKSRFDMVYYFNIPTVQDNIQFIQKTANNLIDLIEERTNIKLDVRCIDTEIKQLSKKTNLRNLKRDVEDIVVNEYFAKLK